MYKLICYIPDTHLEPVKEALFAAGAGKIGLYEKCCFQSIGQGQFQPLPGSHPAIGQHHQLHYVKEYKVEMIVSPTLIHPVIQALKTAHPYEEPAYDVIKLEAF